MKIKTFFLICCLALQACPGGNPEDVVAENAVAKRVFPAADEILAKVYDNLYQSPANFYVDERAENSGRGITGGAFAALPLITALPPPL